MNLLFFSFSFCY